MSDLRDELRKIVSDLQINPDCADLKGALKEAWRKWHPDKLDPTKASRDDKVKQALLKNHYVTLRDNVDLIQEKRQSAPSRSAAPPPPPPPPRTSDLFSSFGKIWAERQKNPPPSTVFHTFFSGAKQTKTTAPKQPAAKPKVTTDAKRPAQQPASSSTYNFSGLLCKHCKSSKKCEMHCGCPRCKSGFCNRQTRVRLCIRQESYNGNATNGMYGPFYEIEGSVTSNVTLQLMRVGGFASVLALWPGYVFVEELLPVKADERFSDWPRETAFTVDENKKVTRHT